MRLCNTWYLCYLSQNPMQILWALATDLYLKREISWSKYSELFAKTLHYHRELYSLLIEFKYLKKSALLLCFYFECVNHPYFSCISWSSILHSNDSILNIASINENEYALLGEDVISIFKVKIQCRESSWLIKFYWFLIAQPDAKNVLFRNTFFKFS